MFGVLEEEEVLNLGALARLGLLLGLDKFGVVDVTVLVLVVAGKDGVNHVDELIILENFGFGNGLPGIGIVIGLVFGWQRRNKI